MYLRPCLYTKCHGRRAGNYNTLVFINYYALSLYYFLWTDDTEDSDNKKSGRVSVKRCHRGNDTSQEIVPSCQDNHTSVSITQHNVGNNYVGSISIGNVLLISNVLLPYPEIVFTELSRHSVQNRRGADPRDGSWAKICLWLIWVLFKRRADERSKEIYTRILKAKLLKIWELMQSL